MAVVKNLPANTGGMGLTPGLGDQLEDEMATCSIILARETPWTWATIHRVAELDTTK